MESYKGVILSTKDALVLIEAARNNQVSKVKRRLNDEERQAISTGSIYIWNENDSGMKRWTDGRSWSASRVSGSFLIYREMESSNTDSRDSTTYRYKHEGFIKQSFLLTTQMGDKFHLIAYTNMHNLTRAHSRDITRSSGLISPLQDPRFTLLVLSPEVYPESILSETMNEADVENSFQDIAFAKYSPRQSKTQPIRGYQRGAPNSRSQPPPQPMGDPQGHPHHAYQPQGYHPQGYPPQGYPPQSYPPQSYAPQTYPPQGYVSHGYAPQGYAPQGFPPQSYAPRAYYGGLPNDLMGRQDRREAYPERREAYPERREAYPERREAYPERREAPPGGRERYMERSESFAEQNPLEERGEPLPPREGILPPPPNVSLAHDQRRSLDHRVPEPSRLDQQSPRPMEPRLAERRSMEYRASDPPRLLKHRASDPLKGDSPHLSEEFRPQTSRTPSYNYARHETRSSSPRRMASVSFGRISKPAMGRAGGSVTLPSLSGSVLSGILGNIERPGETTLAADSPAAADKSLKEEYKEDGRTLGLLNKCFS